MNLEKLLADLNKLDPYKTAVVRNQLDAYNERKMISMLLRYALIGFGILVYLMTH